MRKTSGPPLRRRFAALLAVLVTAIGFGIQSAATASAATAQPRPAAVAAAPHSGITPNNAIGGTCWGGWFSGGCLDGEIDGSGTYVTTMYGSFAGDCLTNWWIQGELFDMSGNMYYGIRGETHAGCDSRGEASFYAGVQGVPGKGCLSLWSNGKHVDSVCFGIHN